MEEFLKQCRPLEALQTCLVGMQMPDASISELQLHPEDSELIILQAWGTAIKFYDAEEVRRLCHAGALYNCLPGMCAATQASAFSM